MKTSSWTAFVSLAMVFAFMTTVDELMADELTTPTSIRLAAEQAEVPKTIPWIVLAPENGRPFNDPFAKLERDQLSDLSYLRRIRRLIAEEKIDPDGDDAKHATHLAKKLATQGIDATWLLVQSRRIPHIRRQQIEAVAKSVAKSIDSTTVEIVGFASPIPSQKQNVAGFLVMPTAAMCGHATAPSPLHVAFVETEHEYTLQSRGTPVRIRGQVVAEPKTTMMMTGSGATVFESAYKILPSRIDVLANVRGSSPIKRQQPQNHSIQVTKEQ